MLSCLVVIALCVVGAFSAPTKVCAPDQWSAAMLGSVGQYVEDKTMALETRGMVATDYKKNMEAVKEEIFFMEKKFMRHYIHDFTSNKSYEIDPMDKKCEVRDNSDRTLKQHCIGDADLKLIRTMSIGGKKANMYEMSASQNSTSLTTVMTDDFSPVTSLVEQNFHGIPQLIAIQYGNYSAKISDPTVFDIPAYCKSEETVSKRVCVDEQFENTAVGRLGQVSSGKVEHMGLYIKAARDYKNKMEAATTEVYIDDKVIESVSIINWNKKTIYLIDPKAKKCTPMPTPTDKMPELCNDSPDLKKVASFEVDGKQAEMYRWAVKGKLNDTFTVFKDDFEPISAVNEQIYFKIPQLMALQYGNKTTGIKDNKVFDLPDYCKDITVLFD